MTIKDALRRLVRLMPEPTPEPVEPGLYHYARQSDGTYTRFHLRVEPDGRGLLLANATIAAHLSPSGVVIARGLLDGRHEAVISRELEARFRGGSPARVQHDLEQVRRLIEELAGPGDNYPIVNLSDAFASPDEGHYVAPLEATLPLAPPQQIVPLLDRLWAAAIPHVTLLVPEAPDPAHLTQAVERAEDLGMIAGVRGRATDLAAPGLLRDLALAGVDHVTVSYASAGPPVHDALYGPGDHAVARRLLAEIQTAEVCPVAEIPLLETTLDGLRDTLADLQAQGIHNYSFFAVAAPDDMAGEALQGAIPAQAMPQVATTVEELAHEADVRFIWQPPVERDPAVSLAEQARRGPRSSGDVAVRVEPDGRVIPPRGPYRSAGNLLSEEWQSIWNDEAFRRYRARVARPTRCDVCPGLALCAADCPGRRGGWAQ